MPDPDTVIVDAIWSAFSSVAHDCNITPSQMSRALQAARPVIEAAATACERQRIRQGSASQKPGDQHLALAACYVVPADLLDGDGDA